MNASIKSKLERLKADYAREREEPFEHFYCPVLYKDEEVRLCEAHIVNKAFSSSARACTVQRHDVDNFYGQNFEADFVDIQRFKDLTPVKILGDKGLAQRFSARICHQNKPVDYFHSKDRIPRRFTPVKVDGVELSVPVALRMEPMDFIATDGTG